LTLLGEHSGEIVEAYSDFWVVGAKNSLHCRQPAPVKDLCLIVATLAIERATEVSEGQGDVQMVGAQSFLADRQRPAEKGLCLAVPTLFP
jgi:hypothetical protein